MRDPKVTDLKSFLAMIAGTGKNSDHTLPRLLALHRSVALSAAVRKQGKLDRLNGKYGPSHRGLVAFARDEALTMDERVRFDAAVEALDVEPGSELRNSMIDFIMASVLMGRDERIGEVADHVQGREYSALYGRDLWDRILDYTASDEDVPFSWWDNLNGIDQHRLDV